MRIINCTPHPITVLNQNNDVIHVFPKGDIIPRLKQESEIVSKIENIPVSKTTFGNTTNLPEPKTGVFLIVSRLVMNANTNRVDLLVPNDLVRDDKGEIIGCKSLAIN